MSKYSENIEAKKELKEKDKVSRETLGKYFYDLSKLSFGAMVLGVVVPWFSDADNDKYWILLAIGLFTTTFLAFFGYRIIKKYKYGWFNNRFRRSWYCRFCAFLVDIYQVRKKMAFQSVMP